MTTRVTFRDNVSNMNRRSFLANTIAASASAALGSAQKKSIPIGLEMYSVRNAMGQDLMGTVRAVAKMLDCDFQQRARFKLA